MLFLDDEAQRRFICIDANGDGLITEREGRDFMMNGTSTDRVKRDENGLW